MTAICLALLLMPAPTSATFQSPKTAESSAKATQNEDPDYVEGMRALSDKDYKTAINSFVRYTERKPDDFKAHYNLGLSLYGAKQYADAIATFRRASEIDPENVAAHYQIGKSYLAISEHGQVLVQFLWLREKDETAAETLLDMLPQSVIDTYQLPPSPTSKVLAKKSANTQEVLPMKADLRPEIIYRERAKYTELARANRVQGNVALSMVYTKDGEITDIRVIRGLPDGLTLSAIKAAQVIRFKPATKDGKPVNVRGTVEYNFTLY